MKKKVELLAPAGDKKSFIGAINAGANAIYLSGKLFGARKYASNFSKEEIKELIEYAHIRNVLVFVTINTMIYEEELSSLFAYSDYLVSVNVDALIVQDLGVIETFVKRYPDTEIHASTQMNAYNIDQVKYLKSIGVKRVILARETSVDLIRKMNKEVDIDLEVFVHGALCVAYSGNCLFSSLNGGRSGNRGECAQPCRLQYDMYQDNQLVLKNTYILSTKDLMSFHDMDEVIDSGVMSLKIEGRMKKPEYVIATVRAYRELLDSIEIGIPFDVEKRIQELLSVFNREYTKGYLNNELPYEINNSYRPNHLGIKSGEVVSYHNGKTTIKLTKPVHLKDGYRIIGLKDVGGQLDRIVKNNEKVNKADKGDIIVIDLPKPVSKGDAFHITQNSQLESELRTYLDENFNLIPLEGELIAFVNKPLEVYIKTPFSQYVTFKSDYIVQGANNPKQTKEKLYSQFDKLGDTPFYLKDFTVQTDEISFIPNSELNNLRRTIIELLTKSLTSYQLNTIKLSNKENIQIKRTNDWSVKVTTQEQYDIVKQYDFDIIYIDKHIKIENDKRVRYYDTRIHYDSTTDLITDYGQIRPQVTSDYPLNVSNRLSVYNLHKRGVNKVALSIEMDNRKTVDIVKEFYTHYQSYPNVEKIVYTRPVLMVTKYCPVTKGLGINKLNCNMCEKYNYHLSLNDKHYPLVRDYGCTMNVLHHQPINLLNQVMYYQKNNITNFRVEFTNESKNELLKTINNIKKINLI